MIRIILERLSESDRSADGTARSRISIRFVGERGHVLTIRRTDLSSRGSRSFP